MLLFKKITEKKYSGGIGLLGTGTLTLRVDNVSRAFGTTWVLKGLNFALQAGEPVAVSGPNGSGKTTLLRILATLLKPTSGKVLINGYAIEEHLNDVKRIMGWMPSNDDGFYPRLTGRENLLLFSSLREFKPQNLTEFIGLWSHLLPLEKALSTPFYLCSTGMKHSLLLMRAISHNPRILILDEPTRSLDTFSRENFFKFIQSYAREKIVLFTTHSREETHSKEIRQLSIRDGKIYDHAF